MHTKFTLTIEDADGVAQTMVRETDWPDASPHFLDATEQALLQVFHALQLESYRQRVEQVARQLAETAQAEYGGTVIRSPHRYRIDGEMGRTSVAIYGVQEGQRIVWTPAAEGFPTLGPREYHVTANFRQLVLTFASKMSFRDAALAIRRVRQGGVDARTPVTTLAERVEHEGEAVQTWMDQKTAQVLAQHHLTAEGGSTPDSTVHPLAADQGRLPQSEIDAALAEYNVGKAEERQIPAVAAHDVYEDPAQVINVSIDDVIVKKQKMHRTPAPAGTAEATETAEAPSQEKTEVAVPAAPTGADALKQVHNTIAHIQSAAGHYILSGLNAGAVLRILVAFLLCQDVLTTCRIQVFADGERALHRAIAKRLAWIPSLRVILDWYHLKKKCGEYLSMALAGPEIRQEVMRTLMGYLWLGRVEDAIAYLQHLNADYIKNQKRLNKTVEYLERHRPEIPCYALRRALGLRNSSNRGEKANDRCVADRQKHNGMSWSVDGSTRLTSTTTLLRNQELDRWCRDGELGWQWVA